MCLKASTPPNPSIKRHQLQDEVASNQHDTSSPVLMSSPLCKKVQRHAGLREVRTAVLATDLTSRCNDQSPAFSKEKTDIHARFQLLRGIWKRKLHQTSNAGNESNWEKVCPGSEGCEEVVEREQLLFRSGNGMGAVEAPQARKLN